MLVIDITCLPIQHVMRWPHFDIFRKTPKQLFLVQIYNRFFLCVSVQKLKDTKHFNNFSRYLTKFQSKSTYYILYNKSEMYLGACL